MPVFTNGIPVQDAPTDSIEIPWTLNRIDESERRIYLTTQNFECSFPETASILESEGTLALTLHGKAPAGPCTQELLIVQTFVQLTSPINGRQVIDGQ